MSSDASASLKLVWPLNPRNKTHDDSSPSRNGSAAPGFPCPPSAAPGGSGFRPCAEQCRCSKQPEEIVPVRPGARAPAWIGLPLPLAPDHPWDRRLGMGGFKTGEKRRSRSGQAHSDKNDHHPGDPAPSSTTAATPSSTTAKNPAAARAQNGGADAGQRARAEA